MEARHAAVSQERLVNILLVLLESHHQVLSQKKKFCSIFFVAADQHTKISCTDLFCFALHRLLLFSVIHKFGIEVEI